MKKLLALFLVIFMMVTMVACDKGDYEDKDVDNSEVSEDNGESGDQSDDEEENGEGEESSDAGKPDISGIFAANNEYGSFCQSSGYITTDGTYIYYTTADGYYRAGLDGSDNQFICGRIEGEGDWFTDGGNMNVHDGYIYATASDDEKHYIYRINIATGEHEFIYSVDEPYTDEYAMSSKFFPGIDAITDMIIVDDTLYFACISYPVKDDFPIIEIGYIDLYSISEPTFVRMLVDPSLTWDAYYMATDYENIYLYSGDSCELATLSLWTKEIEEKFSHPFNYSFRSLIPGINGFGYISERVDGEYDYLFVTMEYGELFEESDSLVTGTEICPVDETFYEEQLMWNVKLIMGNSCFVFDDDCVTVYKDMDFNDPQVLDMMGSWTCYENKIYMIVHSESGERVIAVIDEDANVTEYTVS